VPWIGTCKLSLTLSSDEERVRKEPVRAYGCDPYSYFRFAANQLPATVWMPCTYESKLPVAWSTAALVSE
jgi:hypothetical protein